MSEKIQLNFEINSEFIEHLHQIMGIEGKGYTPVEHFKNALELYAKIVESMAEGKVPVMVDPKSITAERIELPMILALFKHTIEVKENKFIDLKKSILWFQKPEIDISGFFCYKFLLRFE